ncbi:alpha/beta fold hydrolase [Nocardia altamirensis]|uniref:alpha/beta fold hydrolase n=1 Tax=Nocardia altamirensis TaxID=472158 RepID=UPI0008406489|nr:alpha/beta hydrolase [Nocardia altamirensis]
MNSANSSSTFRRRIGFAAATAVAAAVVAATPGTAAAQPATGSAGGQKPTVVLVHGAFADSSSWNGAIGDLSRDGYRVIAAANPLRGLDSDADYVASIVKDIAGPVVLVGHSYGGSIISKAAREAGNVKSLVYIAASAPDEGENTLTAGGPDLPHTEVGKALCPHPIPDGVDLYLDHGKFHDTFAQDVPAEQAAVMAATQRPVKAGAFEGVFTGQPAWKSLPSYYLVSGADHVIHPDAQRAMAKRIGAKKVVEVDSSHAVAVSHPHETADLIRAAAQ